MRFFEISSGLRMPISEEEQELMNLIVDKKTVCRDQLDERQQEVARLMVGRGLLNRRRNDEKHIVYEPNGLLDLWRM